ncbi:MAG TPA: hypothetical protein VJN21_08410 [Candidatus Acidoferrales bacterium]|nr:hypothetical protein [Candidatus Acidoferrales bacterium]
MPGSSGGQVLCTQCDKPEGQCSCEKFCVYCQSQHAIRLCEDGMYYCPDCREACELDVAEKYAEEK